MTSAAIIMAAFTLQSTITAAGTITGRATVMETGTGLAGVTVRARPRTWTPAPPPLDATTDSTGSYTIGGLAAGRYFIYGSRSGYGTAAIGEVVVEESGLTTAPDLEMTGNPGRIEGTIDLYGVPQGGIYVSVAFEVEDDVCSIGKWDYSNTDTSPNYAITDLNPGSNYRISVGGSEINGTYHFANPGLRNSVPVSAGTATIENFSMVESARLFGTVTDESGTPVEGAAVHYWYPENGGAVRWSIGVTSSTGLFEFLVLPGYAYRFEVDPPDGSEFVKQRFDVFPTGSGDLERNVILEVGAISLSGRVTDAANGLPIANARVHLWHSERRVHEGASTDSNGNYAVHNFPPGYIDFEVFPESDYAADGLEDDFAVSTSGIDFALVEECRVSGTVRDMATQQPLAGIEVEYERDNPDLTIRTSSDSQGRFQLATLPTGGTIQAKPRPDRAYGGRYFTASAYPVDLEPGESIDYFPLYLREGALVSGTVRDASGVPVPLEEWFVSALHSDGTETDCVPSTSVGHYQMRLAVGRHRIALDEDRFLGLPRSVEIVSPNDDQVIDFTSYDSTSCAKIEGTLSNPAGYSVHPDSGMEVVGTRQSGGWFSVSTIEDINLFGPLAVIEGLTFDDSYSLAVPPDEDYQVILVLAGPDDSYVSRGSINVTAGPAGSVTSGIDLIYDSEGGSISGMVRLNGSPASSGVVLLTRSSGEAAGVKFIEGNASYTFHNVPAGDYFVQAGHAVCGSSAKVAVNGLTDGASISGMDLDIAMSAVAAGISLPEPGKVDVHYMTEFGRDYRVEATTDLDHWGTVWLGNGDGGPMTWTDSFPIQTRKFYRVWLDE